MAGFGRAMRGGGSLQPGEAIGDAAAQSCRFLIDYRRSNMMHTAEPPSLGAGWGSSLSAHHATGDRPRVQISSAAAGSPQLIPCHTEKNGELKKVNAFLFFFFFPPVGAPMPH